MLLARKELILGIFVFFETFLFKNHLSFSGDVKMRQAEFKTML